MSLSSSDELIRSLLCLLSHNSGTDLLDFVMNVVPGTSGDGSDKSEVSEVMEEVEGVAQPNEAELDDSVREEGAVLDENGEPTDEDFTCLSL